MPTVALVGVRLDATDVLAVAGFWAKVLGWSREQRESGEIAVIPSDPSDYTVLVAIRPDHPVLVADLVLARRPIGPERGESGVLER